MKTDKYFSVIKLKNFTSLWNSVTFCLHFIFICFRFHSRKKSSEMHKLKKEKKLFFFSTSSIKHTRHYNYTPYIKLKNWAESILQNIQQYTTFCCFGYRGELKKVFFFLSSFSFSIPCLWVCCRFLTFHSGHFVQFGWPDLSQYFLKIWKYFLKKIILIQNYNRWHYKIN